MPTGTGGFFVHNLISVLWSLCFIFFLHQNTLIPSQDIKSLIQLCYQAPTPVSCDLHLVQIQRRPLGCNFCQSPDLETKKRSYCSPFIQHAVMRRGRTIAMDASVRRREEWKGDGNRVLKSFWSPARHTWPPPLIQGQGSFPVFFDKKWLMFVADSLLSHIKLLFQSLLFILNCPVPLVQTGSIFASQICWLPKHLLGVHSVAPKTQSLK